MGTLLENNELSELLSRHLPREAVLPDGGCLTLAPLVPSDWPMLEELLQAIPDEERRFFRRESSEPERVQRWCRELDYNHCLPLLAWDGAQIAADAVLQREPGLWTAHVGKFRVMVHPQYRGRGAARLLTEQMIQIASHLGLHKLVNESAAGQRAEIACMRALGFREVARLPEFIRDRDGHLHDMVLSVLNLPTHPQGDGP